MNYRTLPRREKDAPASPIRSASNPATSAWRVGEANDTHEQEADRVAEAVMGGRGMPSWSISKMKLGTVQRQTPAGRPGDQPAPKPNNYDEAAKKLGEAFLKTDVGKKLTDAAKQDPLVKGAESFIDTLPGKIIAGTAAVGAVSALAATHTALPAQIPEIPLDSIRPGLSVKITYEGPVDHPTKAAITFSYSPKGEEKQPKQTASERYRAEMARIAAEQEKFRAGMKYKPGAPEDIQQKQEQKAIEDYTLHRFGALPGTGGQPLIPTYPALKGSPDMGLRAPTFESPFKPKPLHVLDQQLELKPLTSATAPTQEEKKEEPSPVQRKAETGATRMDGAAAPAIVHEVLNSPGQPLDKATRDYFEPRFGHDFTGVRVHTDDEAQASAAALGAQAYAVGSHMVFNRGLFSQSTTSGRLLIAHELAHVIQQKSGPQLQRKGGSAKKFAAGQLVIAQIPFPLMDKLGGMPGQKKVKQIAKGDLLRVEGDAPGSGGLAYQVSVMLNSNTPELDNKGATKAGVASPGWLAEAPAAAGAQPAKEPPQELTLGGGGTQSDTGIAWKDREPLEELDKDYTAEPSYVDNIVHGWYDILTNRFDVDHEDGTSIDLDADSIRKIARTSPTEKPPRPIFAGGLFFRNRSNGKIYPVHFTANNIPNIVWCWRDIEKQMPEATEKLKEALIDVAVAAHGVAQSTLTAGQKAAKQTGAASQKLKPSQIARRAFGKLEPEYAEKLGVGPGGVVHHAKELQLLDKYPGVFTEEELNAFRNMRGIPAKYNNELHLSGFRKFWNEAYEFLDSVIKEEKLTPGTEQYDKRVRDLVESRYRQLDDKFGDLYTKFGESLK